MGMSNTSCLVLATILFAVACKKSTEQAPPEPNQIKLTYGDSVLYIKDGEEDNIVLPQNSVPGKYSGFPDGIELNETTGAINVDESETGLRYRISFVPNDNPDTTITTVVLLSGINYLDNIYYLDENDTIAPPIYNGRLESAVPGTEGESVFDEGGGCNGQGVAVNVSDGTINIAASIRQGVFGHQLSNGNQKEVEMLYRISDGSKKALNKLKVKLYYFDTPDDISDDLVQLMNDRKGMFIGIQPQPPFYELAPSNNSRWISNNSVLGTAKPRPPCIFVVGRRAR